MNARDVSMLFSGEDFRWQMRFDRGDMRTFFAPGPRGEAILAERRRWFAESRDKYAVLDPGGVPLLSETIELAAETGALMPEQCEQLQNHPDPLDRCVALGGMWEADFALLGPDEADRMILQGGAVCFPTAWSLPEKVGKPMHAIHSPVPQLNETIGRQIDLFLSKLRPGVVWLRSNWGLVRTPELNQHPERHLPRLVSPVHLHEAFLRVERQALICLPRTRGVLFGIRIEQLSLEEVGSDPEAVGALAHGLKTMDEEIAGYKGFAPVRAEILQKLAERASEAC